MNVDNSSLGITDDTLNVKAGGITSTHILDGTIVNADISDPSISISAGDGLYGAPGSIDLGETMLLQVNVDGTTLDIINDTLTVIASAANVKVGNQTIKVIDDNFGSDSYRFG